MKHRFVAPFCGLLVLASAAYGQPVSETRGGDASSRKAAGEQGASAPSIFTPAEVLPLLHRIVHAQEAQAAGGKTSEETKREEADLKAQQDMAKWAMWMFVVSAISTILSAAGFVFLIRNFNQTRRSTQAAVDAAEAAAAQTRAMIAMDRPILVVTDISIENTYEAGDGVKVHGIDVTYTNHGRAAVLIERTGYKHGIYAESDIPPVPTYMTKIDSPPGGAAGIYIKAGESFKESAANVLTITPEQRNLLNQNQDGTFIWIWGEIVYSDHFNGVTEAGFIGFQYPEVNIGGNVLMKAGFRMRGPAAYCYRRYKQRDVA